VDIYTSFEDLCGPAIGDIGGHLARGEPGHLVIRRYA